MSKRGFNLPHPSMAMLLIGFYIVAQANCFVETPPFQGEENEENSLNIDDLDGRWVIKSWLYDFDRPDGARPPVFLTIRNGRITSFEFEDEGVSAIAREQDAVLNLDGNTVDIRVRALQQDPLGIAADRIGLIVWYVGEFNMIRFKGVEHRNYDDNTPGRPDIRDDNTYMERAVPWLCCVEGECVEVPARMTCIDLGGVQVQEDCLFNPCASPYDEFPEINSLSDLDGRWALEEGDTGEPDVWFTIRDGQITSFEFAGEGISALVVQQAIPVALNGDTVQFVVPATQLSLVGAGRDSVIVTYNGQLHDNKKVFFGDETRTYDDLADRSDVNQQSHMRRRTPSHCCRDGECVFNTSQQDCTDRGGVWVEEDCLFDPCN